MYAMQPILDKGSYFGNAVARLDEGPNCPATTTRAAKRQTYNTSAAHSVLQRNKPREAPGAGGMTKLDFSVSQSAYRARRATTLRNKPSTAPATASTAQRKEGERLAVQVTKKWGMKITRHVHVGRDTVGRSGTESGGAMEETEYKEVRMESQKRGSRRARTGDDNALNDDASSGGFAAASGFQQVREAW